MAVEFPSDLPQPLDFAAPPNLGLKWIVEPWICRQRLTLIVGEGGSAKSLLLFDLAVATAMQQSWLGTPTNPANVIYFDQDQGEADTWIRLDGFARGRGAALTSLNGNLTVFAQNSLRVDDPTQLGRLHRIIDLVRPSLIIFDSLTRFHRQSEKDNSEMAAVSAEFRKIAEHGPAVVVVHHLSKDQGLGKTVVDRVRGASDLVNASDSILSLRRDRGTPGRSIVRMERSRLIPSTDWPPRMAFDTVREEDGRLFLCPTAAGALEKTIELIRQHNLTGTVREIQAALTALNHQVSRGTVHSALKVISAASSPVQD